MSREACVKALDNALATDDTQADTTSIAKSIESSIHAKNANAPVDTYKNEIRSKLNNLKSNPEFRHSLTSGSLDPSHVAQMTPEDMATPQKRAENEEIRREGALDAVMVNTLERHDQDHQNPDDLTTGIVRNTGQDGIEYDAP